MAITGVDSSAIGQFGVKSDSSLTLKAPNKKCSRRHFNFLLLSFEENKQGYHNQKKNFWKMNFFSRSGKKSGNFVDGQGNLKSQGKVREF